ncbi:MAG TPA: ABC transporter substrate-binding protein [Deinococcales bacterium]|nr:ABC transporter substrate-binding protein [Deinococcales bacterium]
MRKRYPLAALALTVAASGALAQIPDARGEIWIYTSMYQYVIDKLQPELRKQFPNLKVNWYTAGSETVAARITAEQEAGKLQADLAMTSDPFWYEQQARAGNFIKYPSLSHRRVPAALRDTEGYWTTVRIPVMVIAYNKNLIKEDDAPKGFKDLADAKWKGKLTMPSPLESGTAFTLVAALSDKYGWDYFSSLKANGITAAGGNGATLRRIASGEFQVGPVLEENIFQAMDTGTTNIGIVYPNDGAVPVPSPIAIFKTSKNQAAAKYVYDWLLSAKAQAFIVNPGQMHAPLESKAPVSKTAKSQPYNSLNLFPWDYNFVKKIATSRDAIKNEVVKRLGL